MPKVLAICTGLLPVPEVESVVVKRLVHNDTSRSSGQCSLILKARGKSIMAATKHGASEA